MSEWILSGFADEIDPSLSVQIEEMRKLGIGYIEVRGVDGRNIADYTPEEAKALKKRLDAGGIRISAIGSPIGKIGVLDDMDAHLAKFRNVMELAKILETDYIRLFSFFIPEGENAADYRDEVLSRMQQLVDAAAGSGLTLLHENEKGIYGDTAPRCLDILESIGSDRLYATFDPANFVQVGQETYPEAYEMLSPYIRYMHIKDALEDGSVVPAGSGIGHVPEILAALDRAGYCGFASLEPHLGNFQGLADLEFSDKVSSLPDGGVKTFHMAYEALERILRGLK